MNNSSDLSCFEIYDNNGFLAVVTLRSTISVISFFCCLCMIFFIIIFQKYLFFTQRLILYLSIATLGYSITSAINVEGYKAYRDSTVQGYCVFTGFLEQVITWWVLLSITCIMVDLFMKVMFNKMTEWFEIGYLFIIFASPLFVAWIPFINLAYGSSGAWCWIRSKDYKDCSDFPFGTVLQFALYYVPLYLLMAILLVLLIIILVKLRKQQTSWAGKFDPKTLEMKKQMQKEVLPLIYYPIIYLVINIPPWITRITGAAQPNNPVLALWIISAIVFPLQGVIIMLAFVFDSETRKTLTLPKIAAALRRFFRREGNVDEYPLDTTHTEEPEIMPTHAINDD